MYWAKYYRDQYKRAQKEIEANDLYIDNLEQALEYVQGKYEYMCRWINDNVKFDDLTEDLQEYLKSLTNLQNHVEHLEKIN